MGSATYYLKARFVNPEADLDLKLRSFLKEGADAEEYWQSNRGMDKERRQEFWSGFEDRFPSVYQMLHMQKLAGGDCNNALAGKLDFGESESIEDNFDLQGQVLQFSAYVWHFADWDILCDFLKTEFGATAAEWLSDEYVCYFDMLQV